MDYNMLFSMMEDELIVQRDVLMLIALACESPNISVEQICPAIHILIEKLDSVIEML